MDITFPQQVPKRFLACGCALLLLVAPSHTLAQVAVTLDGSTTYQTIDGFGVNLRGGDDVHQTGPVLDALVGAGLTMFRVIQDEQNYMAGPGDHSVYGTGYFSNLVGTISYLNKLGITNGIHLNFMGGGKAWMVTGTGTQTHLALGQEANWADMVGSLVAYLRSTNQLQFSLVEPENESDQTPGTQNKPRIQQFASGGATGCTNAYHALVDYLNNNGLSDMRVVGLASAFLETGWTATLLSDPLVRSRVSHTSMHSYTDTGSAGLWSFLQANFPGTNFWMTEYSAACSTCEGGGSPDPSWGFASTCANYMVDNLANGAACCELFTGCDTWMRYLNGGSGGWSLWGAYGCDNVNASFKTYSPRHAFFTLAQVSKYVKPGAKRIAISGAASPLNMVAFFHPVSGQVTLTGVNQSGNTSLSGTLNVLARPATMQLYYTTATTNLAFGGSFPVTNGAFNGVIPANSVFTLVGQPAFSVILTNPPDGATYSAPATLLLQAAASTDTGVITDVAFYAGSTSLGDASVAPFALVWSNVTSGTYTLKAWATNSLGFSVVSTPVHLTVVGLPAQIRVSPTNALVSPGGNQLFTATLTDVLGTPVNPQPAFAWSVDAGGNVGSNGLFVAGGNPGGPFTLTANAGGFIGSATANIATNGALLLPYQATLFDFGGTLLVLTNRALAGPWADQSTTDAFSFAYANRDALLSDGWSFFATSNGAPRNTEITNSASGAVIVYNSLGPLLIPCDLGDLWASANNTRNSLFRALPTNWLSFEVALSFQPSVNYQQVHLALYQDDDNYLETGLGYNGGQRFTMSREAAGSPFTLAPVSTSRTNVLLRLDQSLPAGTVTGSCYDGTSWSILATTNSSLLNPRLAIWTGGAQSAYSSGMPVAVVRGLTIVALNAVPRTLTYTLLNSPSGAAIDTNGIITWQPSPGPDPTTNVITVVVTDNSSPPLSATNSFMVVVFPSPAFRILSVAACDSIISLVWESETGRVYRLQYKTDLGETNWQEIQQDIVAAGSNATTTNEFDNGAARLYRIRRLP